MAKLLIIEDDADLREAVSDFLCFSHHLVETAKDCQDAEDKLLLSKFDLLVVDWDLPDGNGIDIVQKFRAAGGVAPVIMLTGRTKLSDKKIGFGIGADDYLTKPFELDELELRVKALLRRSRPDISNNLSVRNIVLEPENYRVTLNGKDISLLPKEFALLQFLMRHINKVFSAEALLERVWESESEASPQAVVACIRRLRQKVEQEGEAPLIRTIQKVGYRLEP